MDNVSTHAAASHSDANDSAAQVRELDRQLLVSIRGKAEDDKFQEAAKKALACELPDSFHAAGKTGGSGRLFRLGPDEWLLRDDAQTGKKTMESLHKEFKGLHAAAVEVSDYYAWLELSGKSARDVLAAGCPLDLHPFVFAQGAFAQSRFGKAAVLLYVKDAAASVFEVQVRLSFVRYLRDYLRAAGRR